MADDEKVPPGTRYDALRMIALLPWETSGEQLRRYLPATTSAELQQGAVSGLGDMRSPHATASLIEYFSELTRSEERRVGKECRCRWCPVTRRTRDGKQ